MEEEKSKMYHYCGSYGLNKLICYVSNILALQNCWRVLLNIAGCL